MTDEVPSEFRSFDCKEYFDSYRDGGYDGASQLWFILPAHDVHIDSVRDALVVGRPGVDGIDFCYRVGHVGVWAFYPIDRRWSPVAQNLHELEREWTTGAIKI